MGFDDLRAVDRLAGFLTFFGVSVVLGVCTALCLPLHALEGLIPNHFVPTILELLEEQNWRAFDVHVLYGGYGILMATLGEILRRKVALERRATLASAPYSSRSTRKST